MDFRLENEYGYKFDEYLKKYGYEYTPSDYEKIPARY